MYRLLTHNKGRWGVQTCKRRRNRVEEAVRPRQPTTTARGERPHFLEGQAPHTLLHSYEDGVRKGEIPIDLITMYDLAIAAQLFCSHVVASLTTTLRLRISSRHAEILGEGLSLRSKKAAQHVLSLQYYPIWNEP